MHFGLCHFWGIDLKLEILAYYLMKKLYTCNTTLLRILHGLWHLAELEVVPLRDICLKTSDVIVELIKTLGPYIIETSKKKVT